MISHTKIVLLVVLALFLMLTACSRAASKPPVTTPTAMGEVPFPYTTPDAMADIKTQTAVALTPLAIPTNTVQVLVATVTPGGTGAESGSGTDAESGGGQAATQAPAAQAPAPAAVPTVARPASYTLQKGEWPICIARRYNLDLNSFFAQNGLNMNSKPAVGTVLVIPTSGTWSSSYGSISLKAHPTTYTVVSGDTIYTIACSYGNVAPEQILAANGLSSASEITAGKVLQIP
jgi:LysM repeat protein